MSEINLSLMFKVEILEYERGWGSKVDEIKYFDNEPEAKNFVNDFNSKNTDEVTPDWYMVAVYCGQLK
jgi:hypothetical protein